MRAIKKTLIITMLVTLAVSVFAPLSTLATEKPNTLAMYESEIMRVFDNVETIEFDLPSKDRTTYYDSLLQIKRQHPEYYYIRGFSVYFVKEINDEINRYSIEPSYNLDADTVKQQKEKIDEATETLDAYIASHNLSEAEKVVLIHDFTTELITYGSYNSETCREISGAFLYNKGVCACYAKTIKYLCNRYGIECYVVDSAKSAHAWNTVKIDGSWYHLDACFDDREKEDTITREYFLIDDDTLYSEAPGRKDWVVDEFNDNYTQSSEDYPEKFTTSDYYRQVVLERKTFEETGTSPDSTVKPLAKPAVKNGWVSKNGKKYYYINNKKQSGWKTIKKSRYYFDKSGVMKKGWLRYKNKRYYLSSSGKMIKSTWKKISGRYYYFNKSGVQTRKR